MNDGLARLGQRWRTAVRRPRDVAAVLLATARTGWRPGQWPAPAREVLARQVLFTGIESLRFILLAGLAVGLAVVLQAKVWLDKFGQSDMVGPLLVAVIIREIGPLLVNFIVIGRSGTAIASELSMMRVRGEVDLLDAQGIDPFLYLARPRVLGVGLAVFGLTVCFIPAALFSGYLAGRLLGLPVGPLDLFAQSVFRAVSPADIFNLLAKTWLPGMATGALCCLEGLSVRGAFTEVPQAATRGVVQSVGALFLIFALVSVLTYL